jgi:hypothetical protein
MKKSHILFPLGIAAISFLAFNKAPNLEISKFNKEHLFSSGGQSGLTGAPGENNCTQCHSGSTQSGATENVFTLTSGLTPVTSYVSGQTYTATVSMASNPAKKGFSATALDGTNTMAGVFTGVTIGGTQDFIGGSRRYVSHTSSSNTSANSAWSWTWDAPSSDVGDVVFYVATNKTNNNGTTAGDVIYLSTHTITSSLSVDNKKNEDFSFNAGYSAEGNAIHVSFTSLTSGDMFLNLLDMNGRSVYTYDMDKASIGENSEVIALPNELKNGMYVVNYFVGNKVMTANILIQK